MMKLKFILSLFLLGSVVAFVGCGGGMKVEYIEGAVTHNGQPVEGAAVTFSPVSGSTTAKVAFGKTDKSGVYKLTAQENTTKGEGKGTTQGDYTVTVNKMDGGYDANLVGKTAAEISELDKKRNNGQYSPNMVPYENKLPEKYNSAETSGLKVTVKKGKNKGVDFVLTD